MGSLRLSSCTIVLLALLWSVDITHAQTAAHFRSWIDNPPFSTYNLKIFPRNSQTEKVEVDVQFYLVAITQLNELNGYLDLVGYTVLTWTNELIMWNSSINAMQEVIMGQNNFWRPSLVLANSVESLTEMGDNSYNIRINKDGVCEWQIGVVSKSACSVDVSYYPFDKQSCKISFTPWGYTDTQVRLNTTSSEMDTALFMPNVEWTLTGTSVEALSSASASYLDFTINLARKPGYFLVNMIIPILILGMLNGLVFLLPADSGERVGYAITAFLTFAVFLTMVSDNLPKSSEPMSLLCFFLTLMLIMSALSTVITIMTLRVYHQDDDSPVPMWLKHVVAFITCRKCKKWCGQKLEAIEEPKPGQEVEEEESSSDEDSAEDEDSDEEGKRKTEAKKPKPNNADIKGISWRVVGGTLDGFFFSLFVFGTVVISCVFLIPLALAATSTETDE
ncbi:neuronal acetylcholine receptor subunit alpha-7-like [Pecten maximus]|uniref:neuronal acetylcholine receptor subunit alpha-7-like n=1 Tax=Pecten maximus TaxID=6579 RepID=UPI001458C82C|nr:neuronal acetylcholine receptor subunit alpha-7-like [Pecten maximus]